MESLKLRKYRTDTELTDYYPLPRSLLDLDMPSTAKILYSVLLDRGTLSQKNHYTDQDGWVYVIYPIEALARTLGIDTSMVLRHLRLLERNGLIMRRHEIPRGPSYIQLYLPEQSVKSQGEGTIIPPTLVKNPPPGVHKVLTNNRRKQQEINNAYYQHTEGESL